MYLYFNVTYQENTDLVQIQLKPHIIKIVALVDIRIATSFGFLSTCYQLKFV